MYKLNKIIIYSKYIKLKLDLKKNTIILFTLEIPSRLQNTVDNRQ